jgi:hypothetical protein
MKFLRLALAALLPLLASGSLQAQAGAQYNAQVIWKWRDAQGHVVVSDRAPPGDVPESRILQRPGGPRAVAAAGTADPGPAASSPASPALPVVDPQLEARRQKAKDEAAAQAQATQAAADKKQAAQKADNCRRARAQLAALESGQRMVRANEKGEREVLDDQARNAELQRTRQMVTASCG